ELLCEPVQHSVPAQGGAAATGQYIHHALETIEARALDEQPHRRPGGAERTAEGLREQARVRKPLCSCSEAVHRAPHELTGRVEPLDAGGPRELADLRVR